MVKILLRDGLELFEIVFGIETGVVLGRVDRLLTNDGVKEVATLRHAAAGRNGSIALGIDQRVAARIGDGVEVARDENFEAVEAPVLPSLDGKAEHSAAREDADHVDAHGRTQIFFNRCEHLERLMYANGALFEAVVIA